MAITPDQILSGGRPPLAVSSPTPSVDNNLDGAPSTVPGSGSGKMETGPDAGGAPVSSAVIPPGVSPEIAGAPQAGKRVDSPTAKAGEVETESSEDARGGEGEPRRLSYVELYQQMSPYRPPTDEELEAERKRQKRQSIFAAISDGISAMSNLYFTTQYAPSSYDASSGMSAKTRERFDKLLKERQGNQREYMQGYMQAMKMDDDNADRERTWQYRLTRDRIADKRYADQAAREEAMAQLNELLKTHQITEAEYKAEIARIKAAHAEEDATLTTEGLRAGIDQKKAAATASMASANASNARAAYYRDGGSRKKGPTLQLEEDEPMRFEDDKDYDRTVMRLAPDYGVQTQEVQVLERYKSGEQKGQPKRTRIAQRPVKDIAADIEREAALRKRRPRMSDPMKETDSPDSGSSDKGGKKKLHNPMT